MNQQLKEDIYNIVANSNYALDSSIIYDKVNCDDFDVFVQVLKELRDEGKLIFTKNGKIASIKSSGMIPAKIVSRSRDFAFAMSLDGQDDYFIFTDKLKGAIVGDTVLLYKYKRTKKGLSAEVQRILQKGSRIITGTIERSHIGCELIADAPYRYNIPIKKNQTLGAQKGQKVKAILLEDTKKSKLLAKVVKIYGRAESAKVCAEAIIDSNNVPTVFPLDVISCAKRVYKSGIDDKDLENRLDLRKKIIFTIDGADAKDLDDAISVEKTEDGWELGVHIADVSYYVKENDPIDKEARCRGTSVYFADRVIPMLPKELSNGICSLNSGEDKLAFSALMHINKQGQLIDYSFKKTIINSKVRGVYDEVNKILHGVESEDIRLKYKDVLESLKQAKYLSDILKKLSIQRGNIDLESSESRFELDDNGVCIGISRRTTDLAEELIENFMIMANVSAALYAKDKQIPFIYRIHEDPNPEKIKILSNLISAIGLKNSKIRPGMSAGDFLQILNDSKQTKYSRIVSHQILRTMAKAKYSSNAIGHFGLSLNDYCHFTSPIRRYPDLAIHRILNDLVSGVSVKKIQDHYSDFVVDTAKNSSHCELRAMKVERDTEKCYMAEYMVKHIGEIYDGVVSSATSKGMFVELNNSVEGFLNLRSFKDKKFIFDGMVGFNDLNGKQTIKIGDNIKVKVIAASVISSTVDFEPVEENIVK